MLKMTMATRINALYSFYGLTPPEDDTLDTFFSMLKNFTEHALDHAIAEFREEHIKITRGTNVALMLKKYAQNAHLKKIPSQNHEHEKPCLSKKESTIYGNMMLAALSGNEMAKRFFSVQSQREKNVIISQVLGSEETMESAENKPHGAIRVNFYE